MRHVASGRQRSVLVALVLAGVIAAACWLWWGRRALVPTSQAATPSGGEEADIAASDARGGRDGEGALSDREPGASPGVSAGILPPACVEDGAQTVAWSEQGGVEQVATRLLGTYRDGEPCVLCQAGYLDLLGHVWSCVVEGDGWVDICVVKEADGTSTVTVMRLDRAQVADALVEEGE